MHSRLKLHEACRRVASRGAALGLFACTAVSAFSTGSRDSLLTNSPFNPATPSAEAQPAAQQPLELIGVSIIGKDVSLSIYDKEKRRSEWISVGSGNGGLEILGYDRAKEQATIKVGGATRTLTLKAAKSGTFKITAADHEMLRKTMTPSEKETEARMFMHDIMELTMQQRAAYEAAHKKNQQQPPAQPKQ